MILVAGLASTGASIAMFTKYNQLNNEYLKYRDLYLGARDVDDMEKYYSLMIKNYNKSKKFWKYLMGSLALTGAVWLYNFVDAVIFSPKGLIDESRLKFGVSGNLMYIRYNF